ncbi:MAG: internal scaffolding protein [Microviridae sp.]|nr:MAG: internal scaffolding protein [Microviridae sp.]
MNIDKETGEITTLFIRTPYNYNTDKISNDTGLDCGPETRTQQQFKDEVDINTIVERFGQTGEMPPTIPFPTEQDFTETFDFQSSMNVIVKARESFMELPAKQRARFQNDPQQFMEFMHNKDNLDEAVKLGFVTIKEKPEEPKPENKEKPKE